MSFAVLFGSILFSAFLTFTINEVMKASLDMLRDHLEKVL